MSLWRKGGDGRWRVVFDAGDEYLPTEPPLNPGEEARPALPPGLSAEREAALRELDRPQLPAAGDLAYVIETREGFASDPLSRGRASLRIWKRVGDAWRLRVLLERPLP